MKYLLYITLVVCFAGCAGENSEQMSEDSAKLADSIAQASTVKDDTVAKEIVTTQDSAADAKPVTTDSTFRAAFRFYYTRSYCGGARPSEEMIKDFETPRLLTNSTLILKNHFTGRVYRCKTSTDGEGAVNLIEGKYDVFLTTDIDPSLPTGFDAKCTTWLNQLLFTVKVNNDDKLRDVTIQFVCNPCDEHVKMRP